MARPTTEAQITFLHAEAVADAFKKVGVTAFRTRSQEQGGQGQYDIGQDFDQRRSIVRNMARVLGKPVTLFLSLHGNAAVPKARGVECWYLEPEDKRIAARLSGAVSESAGRVDRGARQASETADVKPDFYFFTTAAVHAVCLELAFVTNQDDCKSLIDHVEDYARAIVGAVCDVYGEDVVVVVDAGHGSTAQGYDSGALAYNHPARLVAATPEPASALPDTATIPDSGGDIATLLEQERGTVFALKKTLDLRQERLNGSQHWLKLIVSAYFEEPTQQRFGDRVDGILNQIEPRPQSLEEFLEYGIERGSREFMIHKYGEDWEDS